MLVLVAPEVVDTVEVPRVVLELRDGVLDAADDEELLPVDPARMVSRFPDLANGRQGSLDEPPGPDTLVVRLPLST